MASLNGLMLAPKVVEEALGEGTAEGPASGPAAGLSLPCWPSGPPSSFLFALNWCSQQLYASPVAVCSSLFSSSDSAFCAGREVTRPTVAQGIASTARRPALS